MRNQTKAHWESTAEFYARNPELNPMHKLNPMKPQTHTLKGGLMNANFIPGEKASAQPDNVRGDWSEGTSLPEPYATEVLKTQLAQVTAQRDQLLAACKEMNAATLAGGPCDIDKASIRIRKVLTAISKATKP